MHLQLAAWAALAAATPATKPNFVILFMDDHGWGDVGCNTGGAVKETPHIDALASGGVRFEGSSTSVLAPGPAGPSTNTRTLILSLTLSLDFHVGFSVCTASRAALLTGRNCPRTDVCNNFGPDSKFGMALQEKTVADLLKGGADYDTHMIG